MRQFAQKSDDSLAWKQEVHRRVAEHRERQVSGMNGPKPDPDATPAPGNRAALAAARVAARYAKAPSYGEMLAEEARAAVRAAEAASKAALEAQAAAESVLAGLEARAVQAHTIQVLTSQAQPWEPDFFTDAEPLEMDEPVRMQAPEPVLPVAQIPGVPAPQSFEIRWDADLPLRETGSFAARAVQTQSLSTHWQAGPGSSDLLASESCEEAYGEGYEAVDGAQPIHANIIQFPRELVATRKVRPRRAEGSHAAVEEKGQLSIFEVDPGSVSVEPAATGANAEALPLSNPVWSGILLDEEPVEGLAGPVAPDVPVRQEQPAAPASALPVAAINRRMLAFVVDFSLVAAAFLGFTAMAASRIGVMPPVRMLELGSAICFTLVAGLYMALFFNLGRATPGMKFAQLELRTLNGKLPTRAQRRRRMVCLLLSLLPAGLGLILAIFDEHSLCWHDRLSGTYLRRA